MKNLDMFEDKKLFNAIYERRNNKANKKRIEDDRRKYARRSN